MTGNRLEKEKEWQNLKKADGKNLRTLRKKTTKERAKNCKKKSSKKLRNMDKNENAKQ